jgi:hypothetical protein
MQQIKRGDVWWVSLDPSLGGGIRKLPTPFCLLPLPSCRASSLIHEGHMKSAATVSCLCVGLLIGPAARASEAAPAPVEILTIVNDTQGHTAEAVAPDGKKYPVFRPASESGLVRGVRRILQSGLPQQALVLER